MTREPRDLGNSDYFHILVRGINGQKIFKDERDKKKILLIVKKYADEDILVLIAYCILDTHAHFLIKINQEDISTIMKKINVSYAYYYNYTYNREGPVFYDRFKSVCIEDRNEILPIIRYIHNNPLPLGYSNNQTSYEWSSYREYLENNIFVTNTLNVLSHFGDTQKEAVNNFIKYANIENNDIFLDVEESIEYNINRMVERYLSKNNIKLGELGYKQNKHHKENLVLMLRNRGKLSIRKISELLQLNRGVVYNIVKKYEEQE